MGEKSQKSKDEIKLEKKTKSLQGKIASARIDAAQGATMFQVLGFAAAAAGIPLAYVVNSTLMILAGVVVGMLFIGVSYILQAQEVIMHKLFDQTVSMEAQNDEQGEEI